MSFLDKLKGLFGRQAEPACQGAISCEEALKVVHEFLDGELEGVSLAEVKTHFEVCQGCYPHLRLEQSFRAALQRACGKGSAPPDLKERVARSIATGGSQS